MCTVKIIILHIRKGIEKLQGLISLDGYWKVLYGKTLVKAIFPNATWNDRV